MWHKDKVNDDKLSERLVCSIAIKNVVYIMDVTVDVLPFDAVIRLARKKVYIAFVWKLIDWTDSHWK